MKKVGRDFLSISIKMGNSAKKINNQHRVANDRNYFSIHHSRGQNIESKISDDVIFFQYNSSGIILFSSMMFSCLVALPLVWSL